MDADQAKICDGRLGDRAERQVTGKQARFVVQDDVGRLDIAMNDTLLMGIIEGCPRDA
jgi:hypothetical protein